jgi:hypothetical protein
MDGEWKIVLVLGKPSDSFHSRDKPLTDSSETTQEIAAWWHSASEQRSMCPRHPHVTAVGGRPQRMGRHAEAESATLNERFTPLSGSV